MTKISPERYPLKENHPPQSSDSSKHRYNSPTKEIPEKIIERVSRQKQDAKIISSGVHEHALSVRQPYAEMIMRGTKTIEYRSIPTNIRGRIYIYASLTPGAENAFKELQAKPGDFPTGVLIGTVELVGCDRPLFSDEFHWLLANPVRLPSPIKADNKAQPVWFIPFKT